MANAGTAGTGSDCLQDTVYSSLYILLLGKLGPKRFLQANWAPENRVPEKWAPGIIYAADWGLGSSVKVLVALLLYYDSSRTSEKRYLQLF